jgi:hypothetical protein
MGLPTQAEAIIYFFSNKYFLNRTSNLRYIYFVFGKRRGHFTIYKVQRIKHFFVLFYAYGVVEVRYPRVGS